MPFNSMTKDIHSRHTKNSMSDCTQLEHNKETMSQAHSKMLDMVGRSVADDVSWSVSESKLAVLFVDFEVKINLPTNMTTATSFCHR